MRNIIIFLVLFLFNSCDKGKAQLKSNKYSKADTFKTFLEKIKPVDLPFIFNSNYDIDLDKMMKLSSNSVDTMFVKTEFPDETYCYGMLTDTTVFYSLIYFFPAESLYPVLATYTKTGELINQESLRVRSCGSDCGLTYCVETGILNKDLTIFCADTSKYDFQCDSVGELIPNSRKTFISIRRGRLTSKGKIIMGLVKESEI